MARRKTTAEQQPDFEKSLEELEALVGRLEEGELSLEESLAQFERGVELTRACQQALSAAERRIQVLSERAGGEQLEDFEAGEDEPEDDGGA